MFSARNKQYLVSAMASQKIANDIEKRLDLAALSSYEASMAEIRQYLVVAFANANLGNLLADKFAQAAACLVAKAAQEAEVPAVAAAFDAAVAGVTGNVELEADVAGVDGNDILLIADGVKDLDTLVADWNAANVGNEVSLLSANGSDVPDAAEEMQLAGGADLIPEINNLPAAKAAFNSSALSEDFKKIIVVALCDQEAAAQFISEHDAMVIGVAALS
jgi:hypothetical protein